MEKTRQNQEEKIAVLSKQLDDQIAVNKKMLNDLRWQKGENTRLEKKLKFNFLGELESKIEELNTGSSQLEEVHVREEQLGQKYQKLYKDYQKLQNEQPAIENL